MNISIKNVAKEKVELLRSRAVRNHRSLQGELLHLIDTAVEKEPADLDALSRKIRSLGLTRVDEATAMIRADRDAR